MGSVFAWFLCAAARVDYLEIIRTLAPVITAAIAFAALRNWQRQDKAKREAEFLDSLIDATHTYVAEMPKPMTLFQFAKIGMESHAPTWESGEPREIEVKGAITYIQKNGKDEAKRLFEVLEIMQPPVIRLRSLVAKGQVFSFSGYAKCQKAVAMLTWQFDRLEAFAGFIGSPNAIWEHPLVRKLLEDFMAMDPVDINKTIHDSNVAILEFCGETYKKIYG
jgi:hypothetical protein